MPKKRLSSYNLKKLARDLGPASIETLSKGLNWVTIIAAAFVTTQEEYGLFAIGLAVTSILSNIISYGQPYSILRFGNRNAKSEILSTSIQIIAKLSISATAISTVAAFILSVASNQKQYTYILLCLPATALAIQQTYIAYLRSENKFSEFCKYRIYYQTIKALTLLSLLQIGTNPIVALTISETLSALPSTTKALFPTIKVKKRREKILKKYGLPFVLHGAAGNLLGYVDRFLIAGLMDLKSVGAYSFLYSISSSILFIYTAINVKFEPRILKIADSTSDVSAEIKKYFRLCIGASTATSILLAIGFETAKRTNFIPTNSDTTTFIILLLSSILHSYYLKSLITTTIIKKLYAIPAATTLSTALNITLNLILIPNYGLRGAAVATTIGTIATPLFIRTINHTHKRLSI